VVFPIKVFKQIIRQNYQSNNLCGSMSGGAGDYSLGNSSGNSGYINGMFISIKERMSIVEAESDDGKRE
jgi:hypothetical protein